MSCVPGGWFGPDSSSGTCDHFYMGQCSVDGYLLGSSLNYVYLLVILIAIVIVLVIIIILAIVIPRKCKKRHIRSKDYKTAPASAYSDGPNINDLAAGLRPAAVSRAPPLVVPAPKPSATTTMIMPEDMDTTVLPPGFEAEPALPNFIKGGTEEQYKAYMVSKLKHETWENQLLLYYRRNPDWAAAHTKKR